MPGFNAFFRNLNTINLKIFKRMMEYTYKLEIKFSKPSGRDKAVGSLWRYGRMYLGG